MFLTVTALLTLSSLPVPPLVLTAAPAAGKVEIIRPTPKKAAAKSLAPAPVEPVPVVDRSRAAQPSTGAECEPSKAAAAEQHKAAEEKAAADKAEAEKAEKEEKERAARVKQIEKMGQRVRDGFGSMNESLSTGE